MAKAKRDIYRFGDVPGPSETFKVNVPAGEDFIVRLLGSRGGSTSVTFLGSLKKKDGGLLAFAGRRIEIELIGANEAQSERRVAAAKKKSVTTGQR